VNEFWTFAQNYWWLAFPIMAVAGGFARRWEFSARARHKRRLEILQAKAAPKAATPPKQVAHATEPKPITKASPTAAGREALRRARRRHRAVARLRADVAKLIAYPTISDGRQPLTAAFLRAKKTADRLRPASPKAHLTDQELAGLRGSGHRLRGRLRRRRTRSAAPQGLRLHRNRAQAARDRAAAAVGRGRQRRDFRGASGRLQARTRRARRTDRRLRRGDRRAGEEGRAALGCRGIRRPRTCRGLTRTAHPLRGLTPCAFYGYLVGN
jgi:hypothetical protein